MIPAIECQGLSKSFGNFQAVQALNLQVQAGEIYGFLGANGAGKTTAMRMLCGLLRPTGGQGRVAGFDIGKESVQLRSRIGYMAQKFSLYPDLSLLENLQLYAGLYGLHGPLQKERIEVISARLEIAEMLPLRTASVPWGWQQRLSMACATMHSPQVLFLDEPTGSVDPLYRRHFWDLIHSFAQEGMAIFVTTHYLDEAEYCHRVGLMDRGVLIAEGTPAQLKKEYQCPTLHQVFLSAIQGGNHA